MIRNVVWFGAFCLLSSCSISTGGARNDATLICRNTVKEIFESLDKDSLETLQSVEEEADLVLFHHGWGTGIRNEYGLWTADSPLRKSCAAMVGEADIHPDGASSIIMQAVWELAQELTVEDG